VQPPTYSKLNISISHKRDDYFNTVDGVDVYHTKSIVTDTAIDSLQKLL